MAKPLGYYAGRMDARSSTSENRLRDIQSRKLETELTDDNETKRLLEIAFSSTIPSRVSNNQVQQEEALADQTIEAAKSIMRRDPKLGIDLLNKGQDIRNSATTNAYRNAQIKQAQLEAGGLVAATITDQDTLNEALPELAKNGIIIPERFGNKWSPKLKEWLDNRKIASDNYIKSLNLEQDERIIDLNERKQDEKEKQDIIKNRLAEAREKRLQGKMQEGNKLVKVNKLDLETELAGLKSNEEFDSLAEEDQIRFAKDVYGLANYKLAHGEAKDTPEAMEQARQQLFPRIDPETGVYKGFEQEAEEAVTPKSKAEFDALPKGTYFINPKDGRRLRKK